MGCVFLVYLSAALHLQGFENLKSRATIPPQWTMRNVDDRNHFLTTVLKLCKDNVGRLPKIIVMDVVEMALWAQENAKALPIEGPRVAGTAEVGEAQKENGVTVEKDPVLKAEEEDMEALLGTYVMGIDEAEAFSERLKRELSALEAANVYAILESEPLVEEVLQQLDLATSSVEDMDEWLGIFNVKLRHMREDIESIEARNNRLEMQAQNNALLVEELNKLLDRLRIPSQYASLLKEGSFDEARMPQNVEACDWLATALRGLDPPLLDPAYAGMRAVKDKRVELDFCSQATDFLRNYLSSLVDFMISDLFLCFFNEY